MWSVTKTKARSSAQRFVLVLSDGVTEWSAPVWRTNVSDVWDASDPVVEEDGSTSRLVWGKTPLPCPWPVWARLWRLVREAPIGEVFTDG